MSISILSAIKALLSARDLTIPLYVKIRHIDATTNEILGSTMIPAVGVASKDGEVIIDTNQPM